MPTNNLYPVESKLTPQDRAVALQQQPKVIWFTGLSGSGKSTLAVQLELRLHKANFKCCMLDGDNIRTGLNKDLGFSDSDRKENIRRTAEVSKLLLDSGIIVLSVFISPFELDRAMARQIVGASNLIEVFIDCPLQVCEERDPKGLYKRARTGEVKSFTGISSPYERPSSPQITIATNQLSIEQSVDALLDQIIPKVTIASPR